MMNGWHRLFVVACVFWIAGAFAAQAYFFLNDDYLHLYIEGTKQQLALFIAPCVVVYILGWCIAWVRRGFK
jgi:hypothetical protein